MRTNRHFARTPRKLSPESGQTTIFVLLVLGVFFLAFVGLAVDYSNLWFHRQMAQGAADAACQAGAMDLLVAYSGGSPTQGGFTPGTAFNCSANPTSAPCQYAALNGYTGGTLASNTPGIDVAVSFPGSAPGVTLPPSSVAASSLIRVDIIDRAPVYFSGLVTGRRATDVRATATCGLQLAKSPIPIIVLNPTCQHAFQVSGSATVKIVGGPTKSVQVNSSNQTCAAATQASANSCSGSGTIDLSHGGPNFTGSNFGVFGTPTTPPTNFIPGATGSWSLGSPIADPYSRVLPPSRPLTPSLTNGVLANSTAPIVVAHNEDGCPDLSGCDKYLPGLYTKPIVVTNRTAIFVPGVYYIEPTAYTAANGGSSGGYCGSPGAGCSPNPSGQCRADFVVGNNGVVRPASNSAVGSDGSNGVMFYLSGPGGSSGYGGAVFQANAGNPGGRTIDNFPTASLSCDGVTVPDPSLGVPSSVPGNVLAAQCTAQGNYYGAPSTDTISLTGVRGLLFFQNRANGSTAGDENGQTNMQGGGGLALSGTLYAHNCPNSPSCNQPPTDYQAFIQLQGTPGSGTYILGEIVADQLIEAGNGSIGMQLNPNAVYFTLKATMLR